MTEQTTETRTRPADYPRRILLAVTGLSPQVVTETLYALTQELDPAFVPSEIHLITTAEGADFARHMLLDPDDGRYFQLCQEHGLDAARIGFDESRIHVISRADGEPLSDITTEADNTAVADAITNMVRKLTGDEDAALHASIAGGRKTMGFYLGYALSLYGRPQDRLSHVLVSQPFESDHQFYFPPRKAKRLIINDRPVHTSDARIMLADIPFVRMRHGIDPRLRDGAASFSDVVASAQAAMGPPELVIDVDDRCLLAGGLRVHVAPAPLAFMSWLARRAANGSGEVVCPPAGAPSEEYAGEFLKEYAHMSDPDNARTARRLVSGMDKEFFEQTLSRLRRRLRESLGPEGALRYGVWATSARPRRYHLGVPPEAVRWEGGL